MDLLTATASPTEALQICVIAAAACHPTFWSATRALPANSARRVDYRAAMAALGQNSE